MKYDIQVENIRCGGCASTIGKRLGALDGVEQVDVDIENGIVRIEAGEGMRDALAAELLGLGYPESGSAEGIAAARAKAKSFVSCAVGKISS